MFLIVACIQGRGRERDVYVRVYLLSLLWFYADNKYKRIPIRLCLFELNVECTSFLLKLFFLCLVSSSTHLFRFTNNDAFYPNNFFFISFYTLYDGGFSLLFIWHGKVDKTTTKKKSFLHFPCDFDAWLFEDIEIQTEMDEKYMHISEQYYSLLKWAECIGYVCVRAEK